MLFMWSTVTIVFLSSCYQRSLSYFFPTFIELYPAIFGIKTAEIITTGRAGGLLCPLGIYYKPSPYFAVF